MQSCDVVRFPTQGKRWPARLTVVEALPYLRPFLTGAHAAGKGP
jgi:hypothetical protein